jgi:hypothetical protein
MSKKPCPLGLDDSCALRNENYCLNFFTCWGWTRPWALPLTKITYENSPLDPLTFDSSYWLVQFHNLYPPVNSENAMVQRNWKEYFANYGYTQAEPLSKRLQKRTS